MQIDPSTVLPQYQALKSYVQTLAPDEVLPGDIKVKHQDGYTIAYWVDDDPETADAIVISADEVSGQRDLFQLKFYESTVFTSDSRLGVRRFVDPAEGMFRNDTVDADNGEHVGSQGVEEPELSAREAAYLRTWLKLGK